MKPISLDELKATIEREPKLFLKVWKPGCGICKLSEPATTRLEASNPWELAFCSIDSDLFPEILEIAEIDSLPTFIIFKEQKKVGSYVGFKGLAKMEEFIRESLGTSST